MARKRLQEPDFRLDEIGEIVETAYARVSRAAPILDFEGQQLAIPAPNAIEWATLESWAHIPSLYRYTRQYQVIRDFFELRCPLCNPGGTADGEPGDCWGKGREYLESEVLLVWTPEFHEDVCPKCRTTRSEFVEDGFFQNYKHLHLITGQRCLSLETTFVWTDRGLMTLGELVEDGRENEARPVDVLVHDRSGANVRADSAVYAGVKPVLQVRTSRGFVLDGSADHRYLVVRSDLTEEWVRAEDLEIGDVLKIRVAENTIFGSGQMPVCAARLIGSLVANGDVTNDYRVRFMHGHVDAADAFEADLAETIQKYELRATWRRRRSPGRNADEFEISGKNFVQWLRRMGVGAQRATTKTVPKSVREGSRDVILGFLSGYFSADGSAGAYNPPKIRVTTVSSQLAYGVQSLLLGLGILTNMDAGATKGFRGEGLTGTTSYTLSVATESLVRFSETIHFTAASKQDQMRQIIARRADVRDKLVLMGPSGSARIIYDLLSSEARRALTPAVTAALAARVHSGPCVLPPDIAQKIAERCAPFLPGEIVQRLLTYADVRFSHVRVTAVEEQEATLMGDLSVPSSESYVANGLVVHNSGKSVVSGIIGTYVEHRLATIGIATRGGLAKYFGLLPGDVFEMMFLASTSTQSSDTIWSKFAAIRAEAPWFRRFIPWCKEQEKRQPQIDGMKPWHYKENDDRIENLHPGIRLVMASGHSNSAALRGLTRVGAFGDEVSHMQQTDSVRGARNILGALERSLATVRTAVTARGLLPWIGSMFTVSSPVSRSDYGWQLLQVDDVPSMMKVHRATWDFNPNIKRADLEDEFRKDPVAAMRDYGAIPPGAEYPYIHDEIRWREAVEGTQDPVVTFRIEEFVDPLGHRYFRPKVDDVKIAIGGKPRFIIIDAGVTFDALSLCVGHMETEERDGDTLRTAVVDGVLRVVPSDTHAVWFQSVVEIVRDIAKFVPVQQVEFDRWESVKLIQDIRELGIVAERRSLSTEDYRAFKNDSFAGLVKMLPPDPDDLREGPGFSWTKTPDRLSGPSAAYYEICGLQQDPDTGKVYNPEKGRRRGYNSNDTAQVVIHLSTLVQNIGYTEKHDDRSRRAARKRLEAGMQNWEQRGGWSRVSPGLINTGRGW